MKLAAISIALLLALTSVGQTSIAIRQLLADKQFKPLKTYIDTATSQFTKTDSGTKAIWKELRDITPEFQEAMIDVEELVQENDRANMSAYFYRLNIIASANEIIYYEWRERGMANDYNYNFPVTDSFRNEQAFKKLQVSFKKTFGTELKFQELFKTYVYGTRCNIDAEPPKLRIQLNKYIKSKNVAALNRWLTSGNSEKQAYGVDGFYQLRKKGYKITGEQSKIIRIIKNKNGSIAVCVGCIHFSDSIKSVLEPFKF